MYLSKSKNVFVSSLPLPDISIWPPDNSLTQDTHVPACKMARDFFPSSSPCLLCLSIGITNHISWLKIYIQSLGEIFLFFPHTPHPCHQVIFHHYFALLFGPSPFCDDVIYEQPLSLCIAFTFLLVEPQPQKWELTWEECNDHNALHCIAMLGGSCYFHFQRCSIETLFSFPQFAHNLACYLMQYRTCW